MRIQLKDIVILFENIQEELNISYVSIVIFTAIDIDSLCTLKIFAKVLKCENIEFKIYPVTTYDEIHKKIQESRVYDKVKLFMFINCGGVIDLTQYWFVEQAQIFLFDVNKPIHHNNIESPYIKVVDDGKSQLQNCPTSEEIQKLDEINEYDLDSNDEQEVQDHGDEDIQDISPKRRNRKDFKQKLKKHKSKIEQKINNYYGNQFFGLPSSYSAYRMVRDLGKANNQYLWYGIVGLTSMYLQQKISKEYMQAVGATFRSDIIKFNPQNSSKRQKGEIASKMGYQFTLLDHWSLYESMMHSNYLMIKLNLWEDKGVNSLHRFLHMIGISLSEAKQLYKFMSVESMKKLQNNIFPNAEKFQLLQVAFPSFTKQVDYAASFIASDYHYLLTSIIQTPPRQYISYDQLHEYRIKCFWEAYDVFDAGVSELKTKIENYKRTVTIFMKEAKSLLERDHLLMMKSAGFANIHNDSNDRRIFEHPSTLIRMAHLLMGISKSKKKSKHYKPFIASLIHTQKNMCTVVGVMFDLKNSVGTKFNEVAQKLKIEVNHDYFMSNIIMMPTDYLKQFTRELGQA